MARAEASIRNTVMKSNLMPMLRRVWDRWNAHDASRLAAALACYAILSLAPLILLLLAAGAAIFGEAIWRSDTVNQVQQLLGPAAAALIVSLISDGSHATGNTSAKLLAAGILLFGASSVFAGLRSSLNVIWEVRETTSSWYAGLIKERLWAFAMVAGLSLLLAVSILFSLFVTIFEKYSAGWLPFSKFTVNAANVAASFAVTSLAFCLIFRFIPAVRIGWKDAWTGALVTAALFDLTKVPLDLYLSAARVGSAYGAAGTLVGFLFWLYVSAQVFYLGAEFTRVHSEHSAPAGNPRSPGTT